MRLIFVLIVICINLFIKYIVVVLLVELVQPKITLAVCFNVTQY